MSRRIHTSTRAKERIRRKALHQKGLKQPMATSTLLDLIRVANSGADAEKRETAFQRANQSRPEYTPPRTRG